MKGPKGLCYDVDKFADKGRRNRILANRASAKTSRQRRLDEAREMRVDLTRLEEENRVLREANAALQTQVDEAQTALSRYKSIVASANLSVVGELDMLLPPAPVTLAYLRNALSERLRRWY